MSGPLVASVGIEQLGAGVPGTLKRHLGHEPRHADIEGDGALQALLCRHFDKTMNQPLVDWNATEKVFFVNLMFLTDPAHDKIGQILARPQGVPSSNRWWAVSFHLLGWCAGPCGWLIGGHLSHGAGRPELQCYHSGLQIGQRQECSPCQRCSRPDGVQVADPS